MSDSWKLYNGIFYKKKTNKKTVSRKISNIMTEKYFSLVNVNVIFNIIFFDYVKEWRCLCDIFFRYSGGGGRGFRGALIWGAFIQSIMVIRTCFSFWIFYGFQCHLFPIQIKLFVYLNYLSFKKWGIFWNQLINSLSIYWERPKIQYMLLHFSSY